MHIDKRFETFGGPFPILVAFLVAFKQVVPEHRIILFGMSLASLRTKDAPMLLLSAGSLLYFLEKILFKGTSTVFIVIYYQIFLGVFTAWTYLRFFQYRDGICGDRSETFAFVTFFPEMLQYVIFFFCIRLFLYINMKSPILRPISNSGFKLMVKLGFCSPTLNRGPLDSPLSGSSESMAPQQPKTSAELDSDRRKALGLRALQMKLSGQNPPAAPP